MPLLTEFGRTGVINHKSITIALMVLEVSECQRSLMLFGFPIKMSML